MKVFVIAMEKEAQPLLDEMIKNECVDVCGKKIILGSICGVYCGIVICGVGKVNAAIGCQIALDYLHADTIINVGVAGGLNDGVKVGEIYSIGQAVQYDFDLTQLNGGSVGTLDECAENYLTIDTPKIYSVRSLATGDRFNDSKQDYTLLTSVLNADIRDMEGGAIAQVCMHAKVKFYSFKIISDIAGSGSTTEQYLHNLSICLQTLKNEIKNILKKD